MKLNVALSARNQLPGILKEIKMGQTTSHLKIDIGGQTLTASITNEAVEELALKVGDQVWGIIKASDVMVAK
jgi:molybdopterin-binding protein